ncbi:hypothetical protein [Streptomyces anulatus]|nr:hypothetical protein [Streptomyces anulatus]
MSSEEDRTGAASLDHAALLKDLQKQVALLEDDASSSASARTTG